MGLIHEVVDHPNIITTTADKIFNWARLSSLWVLAYGIACCAIEFMATAAGRYDFDRYGIVPRATPRQADFLLIAGPVIKKMAPVLRTLYAQMAEPKYMIAIGSCAISGGVFHDSFNVVQGAHKIIPVDVYVPGCHPRPEGILFGMLELQELIEKHSFVDVKRKLAERPIVVPTGITESDIIAKAKGQ